ncbi:hypothetical protein BC833DRAFT_576330, partial [Globomyces pollinis-pini]
MNLLFLLGLFFTAFAIPQTTTTTCYCYCGDGAYAGTDVSLTGTCSASDVCTVYSSTCAAFGNGASMKGSSVGPTASTPNMGEKSVKQAQTASTAYLVTYYIYYGVRGIGGIAVFLYCCYYYYVQRPRQRAEQGGPNMVKA